MAYDIKEHKHRYAIWTAARAVQRSFTTTNKISYVINKTDLRGFAESENKLRDQEHFDYLQRGWCHEIISEFDKLGIVATYGRAAKMIAVYLKTSVVISGDTTEQYLRFIHPPVDRILIKNISKITEFKEFRKLNWTKLEEQSYWILVDKVREQFNFFDWRLEMFWTPEQAID